MKLQSISDPVLIRADGTPLYTFCSVVDDLDFAITHVIRGEDHVTNTGIQLDLFEALGGDAQNIRFATIGRRSELPDFTAMPGATAGPQHRGLLNFCPTVDFIEDAWDDFEAGVESFVASLRTSGRLPRCSDGNTAAAGHGRCQKREMARDHRQRCT